MNATAKILSLRQMVLCTGLLWLLVWPFSAMAARVTLAWDSNTESNLAGYIVYWGTASRDYPHRADVGNRTSHPVTDLLEGRIYYFAVAAYDSDGRESGYSDELVYAVPNLDSDADGLWDRDEIDIHGTDPYHPDTDRDQMDDGWEIGYGTDPLIDDAAADLDGNGLSNLEEYNGATPSDSQRPQPPLLLYPSAGHSNVSLTPVLETESSQGPDAAAAHTRTLWQVSESPDFDRLVFDLESTVHLKRLALPDLVLLLGGSYWWRASYVNRNGLASDWSDGSGFTTTSGQNPDSNANGVPDHQEPDGPVDLDRNGSPDRYQSDITCVQSMVDGSIIAIKTVAAGTRIRMLKSMPADAVAGIASRPDHMPAGLLGFRLELLDPGDTVAIRVYFDRPLPSDRTWYRFTPAAGWADASARAAVDPDGESLVLTLTDGGLEDADGTANGVIVNLSGPAEVDGSAGADGGGGGGCFIESVARPWPWPWRSD